MVNVVRPDLGGGVLFSDLFEGLVERGIQVTVKCAYSYYPEWTDKSGKNGFEVRSSTESGVTIERHGLYIPRNPNSLLQRLLYEASFFLSLRRHIPAEGQFDAVMVFCPLIGSVAYAAAVKKALDIPMWLNVQDLSAQAASASGITESNFIGDFLLDIQNTLFAHADVWTSISRPMMNALNHHNPSDIPIRFAPNWLHPTLAGYINTASQNQPEPAVAQEKGESDPAMIKLLYSGNVGTKQSLLTLCKHLSASPLKFSFRIQGAGGRFEELSLWVVSSGDDRFILLPLSDEESLARALVECDFYVITEKPDSGNSFIPSKLIPAISSRTPVLAVCDINSPLGEEVTRYNLGPLIEWSNVADGDSLTTLLAGHSRDSETYVQWISNCADRAGFYEREAAIDRYADILSELLTGNIETDTGF